MRSSCGERKVLEELAGGRKTLWELLASYPWSMEDFARTLNRLHRQGKISVEGEFIRAVVPVRGRSLRSLRCPGCGRGTVLEGHRELERRFRELARDRPRPELGFSQGYMRKEDVWARVALMHHYEEVEGKSIVLVGDDDLVGLALALTGLPERVTVLDIDGRLGEFLEEVGRREGLEVEFVEYDVRDPLPRELRGRFEVFVTDPPEEQRGLRAFLCRAVCALRPSGSSGYFGLTSLESPPERWLWLQRWLSRRNLVLTDILRDHSFYPTREYGMGFPYEEPVLRRLEFEYRAPPSVDWYRSAFLRVTAVGRIRPPACGARLPL
jgi:predicted methyltransferase